MPSSSLKNINSPKTIKYKNRAEGAAIFLQNELWANENEQETKENEINNEKIIHENIQLNENPLKLSELKKQSKN